MSRGDEKSGSAAIAAPSTTDGAHLWRIARDSRTLDLNSSYAYLLWCRDFAATSALATVEGTPVGFVTGYLRPAAKDTLVVWQVAVDASQRGKGLAGALLDHLVDRVVTGGARYLETTITADNEASIALFGSLAKRWNTRCERGPLFTADQFPDGHDAEDLYRIGPFQSRSHPTHA